MFSSRLLVIIGTAAVTPRIGLRARAAVIVTMLPPVFCANICLMESWVTYRKALDVRRDERLEVLGRVVRERLGEEDPGVVDQCVDRLEARHRRLDDPGGS